MTKKKKDVYLLSRKDNITDIIEKSPRATELLTEYGINCVNCILKQFETLEIGAQLHGMSEEEIDKMVEEINQELVVSRK